MSWLPSLHLFRFFELYLTLMFLVSTYLRIRQYHAFANLLAAFPGRWPRLFRLVKQHHNLFLTWGTVLPLAVSLILLLAQTVARQIVWPAADEFTALELLDIWPAVPVVVLCGAAMAAFDAYGTWNVGEIDRRETEKYFDQAEFWLTSPAAKVVHIVTFGFVNPRKMVAIEVRAALVSASQTINSSLWWVAVQAGLRIAFGISLWAAYLVWLHGS